MSLDRCIPNLVTGGWLSLLDGTTYVPYIPDNFLYGVTVPVCEDPLNPKPTDNVGWNGDASGGTIGDPAQPTALTVTIPANTTWTNRKIYANVIFTDVTSQTDNCIIFGGAYATNRLGITLWSAGANMKRTTLYGTSKSVNYYTNASRGTGGTLTTDRCVIMRTIDAVRCSGGNARWIDWGSYITRLAAFDNDADHPTAGPGWPAGWTHNDALQASAVSNLRHELHGTRIDAFFETKGVTWSGGTWGSGTASGGEIGMPSTMLNAGYYNVFGKGTWSNGVTMSNASGHKLLLDHIFIDGVNATSGMVQFTVSDSANPNQVEILGGKWGLGGKPSGSGKFYLCTWGSSTIAGIGTGNDAPRFADLPSVPPALRGKPLVFTATGSSIVP